MSKHGCTRQAAMLVKERIASDEVVLIDLNKTKPVVDDYDCIVIGGSIHAGSIQKHISEFCDQYSDVLKRKKLGLFLCCMKEGVEAKEQFRSAYSEDLREHSSANGLFGGEFNFKKMNFFEKFLVKKIAKVDRSVSNLNKDAIAKFVDVLLIS